MPKKRRIQILSGVLLAVAVVAVFLFKNMMAPERPAPNAKGYFSGAMLNKAGTAYTDDNGNIMPTPPGAPPPPNAPKMPPKPEGAHP